MKTLNIVPFYLIIIISTAIHSMDKQPLTWVKTKDRKRVTLTKQERCHSSYINKHVLLGSSKKQPITVTNATKKEMRLFKELLHKPALYDNHKTFPQKKYYKALTVAEKLKAPLLYAELLQARLPENVIDLIAQNYREIQNISDELGYILFDLKNSRYTEKELDEALDELDEIIENTTLPQAMMLSLIHDKKEPFPHDMQITPHMPGYKAFSSWTDDQLNFILNNLPIETQFVTTKTGLEAVSAVIFNV